MSIPKVIHYCWFGSGQIPERDQACIASWKKYCPDYQIILWNEANYDVTQIPYMCEAYEAGKWGFVPDYARMDIIYRHGGIYLDTDVELLKPLDDLLEQSGFAALEAGSDYINFGLGFGAEPGSPLLEELLAHYRTLSFLDAAGKPDLTPNPAIATDYLQRHGHCFPVNAISQLMDFTLYPKEYFCPQNFFDGALKLTPNTYSIHHYHASWQTEAEKQAFFDYRRFTKLFGETLGNLVYQTFRTLREQGAGATAKKIFGHFRKER